MPFKTKLKTKSVRRVVITLPEAITDNIVWADIAVEGDLAGLYDALRGLA